MIKPVLLIFALLIVGLQGHKWSEDTKVKLGLFEGPNAESELEQFEGGFVMFYQTWCGHCKKLMPEWENAAAQNQIENVSYVAVDCGKAKAACQKMSIRGYPTLMYMKDTQNFYKYQGARTTQGFEAFLKGGYSKQQPTNFAKLKEEASKQNQKQEPKKDNVAETLAKFKKTVTHMHNENYTSILGRKSQFVLLYADFCGHCKKFLPSYQQLFDTQKEDGVEYVAVDVKNTEQNNQPLARVFGVTGFPTIVYIHDGMFYRYNGGRTVPALQNYVKNQDYLKLLEGEKQKESDYGKLQDVRDKVDALYKVAQNNKKKQDSAKDKNKKASVDSSAANKKVETKEEDLVQKAKRMFEEFANEAAKESGLEPLHVKILIAVVGVLALFITKSLFLSGSSDKKKQKVAQASKTAGEGDKKTN